MDITDTSNFNQANLAGLVFALVEAVMKVATTIGNKNKDEDHIDHHDEHLKEHATVQKENR